MLTGSVLTGTVIGLVVAALLATVLLCAGRVRRLHRLHVRTDAARGGLDAALRRRTEVAHKIVERESVRIGAESVFHDQARPGMGPAREAAENALGRRLAALDRAALTPAVRGELADAERLVVLGRHVYNDAVRDTLDLRARRLVRWLRLHGTAPLPTYFEIADPEVPVEVQEVIHDASGAAATSADVGSAVRRIVR